MNSHVVSKEMFTRMTSAYAYGTYAPMDWLRTELVEIADKVKKQVAVIVEVDGAVLHWFRTLIAWRGCNNFSLNWREMSSSILGFRRPLKKCS